MAKKIKIPKKVLIGGVDYTIRFVEKFKEDQMEHWGFCSNRESLIELLEFYDGNRFSDAILLKTLLHELLHAIDYVYCNYINTEHIVVTLTEIVYQLLSDNDFYIGEDKFPKFIRIFGIKHKVINNYDFGTYTHSDPSTCVATSMSLIRIVGKEHTSSVDIITSNLFEVCLQSAANQIFEDAKEINITGLAAGLYQVLKSTKLDKMIRECNK